MYDLTGKKALVTAAGQGIGRAIAEALAAHGATVVATDINEQAFQGAATGSGLQFMPLDVTDDAQVEKVVGEVAPYVLVNVAGVVHHGTILDTDADQWDFAMKLNARAAFITCRAALPHMVEQGGGCIVNISSVASSLRGVPFRFTYSTSKGALIGLTKSIAADFVKHGVRANAICPGTVRTPSWEQRVRELAAQQGVSEDEARASFEARQPMGRVGEVGEIASMAVYLASKEGEFMTGQEICIDGGWSNL